MTESRVYVIPGKPSSAPVKTLDLRKWNATTNAGVIIQATGGYFGWSVAGPGDVNGDGVADIVAGLSEPPFKNGNVYTIYGSSSLPSVLPVGAIVAGQTGTIVSGSLGYEPRLGKMVYGVGDVNNDGRNETLACTDGGARYCRLLYGTTSSTPPSAVFTHTAGGGNYAASASTAGDINGDGCDEFLIGYFQQNVAFLVFGKTTAYTGVIELSDLTSAIEFRGTGYFSTSVSGGRDLNGDGFPDIVFAAPTASAVYIVHGPFEVYPTALPSVSPTLVPTAAPTYTCVQWTLGEVGATCAATCSGASPVRVCKEEYLQTVLTAADFYDIVGSSTDARTGGFIGSAQDFCNGGILSTADAGAPSVLSAVLQDGNGGAPVRRFCSYATSPAAPSVGCNGIAAGLPSRRFCPCVYGTCDEDPWYLGLSGESCTSACAREGRVCAADTTGSITDETTFTSMLSRVAIPSDFCTYTNSPQFEPAFPAAITVNLPTNLNHTYCSHPTSTIVFNNTCDVALTSPPAQRFCACGSGRRLSEETTASAASAFRALPSLRGAMV